MDYRLIKLDGRFSGNRWFSHRAEVYSREYTTHGRIKNFNEARQYLWEAFGPSCELDLYDFVDDQEMPWAWDSDNNSFYIYLRDSALTQFTLKWN